MIAQQRHTPFVVPPGLLAACELATRGIVPATRAQARLSIAPARPQHYLLARRRNGNVAWCGFFRTRAQSERFVKALTSGELSLHPALWDLPTPSWAPGIGGDVAYEFSTTVTATGAGSTTASAGTYKADLEAWGAGGSGGSTVSNGVACGAGAGGYAGSFGIAVTGGSAIYWSVGVGGTGVTGGPTNGNAGGSSWINAGSNSSPGSSSTGAAASGGSGGQAGFNAHAGTAGSGTVGSIGYTGGSGGGAVGGAAGGGGGGAGSGGNGTTGVSGSGTTNGGGGAGGSPDGGSGSAGITGTTAAGTQPGGGSGAALGTGSNHSGNGGNGMARYTFYISPVVWTNLAMLGM